MTEQSKISRIYRTADGHEIVTGMFVWTNDIVIARVERFDCDENGAGWFILSPRGMADGSRMAVRHPSTRVVAGPGVIFRHFTSFGESDYRYLTDDGAMVGPFDSEAEAEQGKAEAAQSRTHPAVGSVTRVDYAHGVFVTFERMPAGTDGYSEDQRWYYAVWQAITGNHADVVDSGYARTKAEAAGYARTAREAARSL